MTVIGLLYPPSARAPRAPEATVFGRAALSLREDGVRVLLGAYGRAGALVGHEATPGGWRALEAPPAALVHRFPDQGRPDAWAALRGALPEVPLVNPEGAVALCRDKLALQRFAEAAGLVLPEVEGDVVAFPDALTRWGAAFLKPRFGAFGHGVRRLVAGEHLGDLTPGAWVLQRAVPAPPGWAGWSCRVLVQRAERGAWTVCPVALRRDPVDPVVNRARGASVVPAEDALRRDALDAMVDQARRLAAAVAEHATHTGELGLDFVIDPEGRPWLIEANGKPGGRLEALVAHDPDRFTAAQAEAARRPFLWAAHLAAASPPRPAVATLSIAPEEP